MKKIEKNIKQMYNISIIHIWKIYYNSYNIDTKKYS